MKPEEFFKSQLKEGIADGETILQNYCIASLVTLAETIEANNLSEEDTCLLLDDIDEKCTALERIVAEHFDCKVTENTFRKFAATNGLVY